MKKLSLAFAVLILAACTPTGTTDNNTTSSSSSSVNERPLSREGEFCGGIAAFQCAAGLTCKYDGTYPDAGGTCVRGQ